MLLKYLSRKLIQNKPRTRKKALVYVERKYLQQR